MTNAAENGHIQRPINALRVSLHARISQCQVPGGRWIATIMLKAHAIAFQLRPEDYASNLNSPLSYSKR